MGRKGDARFGGTPLLVDICVRNNQPIITADLPLTAHVPVHTFKHLFNIACLSRVLLLIL